MLNNLINAVLSFIGLNQTESSTPSAKPVVAKEVRYEFIFNMGYCPCFERNFCLAENRLTGLFGAFGIPKASATQAKNAKTIVAVQNGHEWKIASLDAESPLPTKSILLGWLVSNDDIEGWNKEQGNWLNAYLPYDFAL